MKYRIKKINSELILFLIHITLTIIVIFYSFSKPSHNFDEIPYTFLFANNECSEVNYLNHTNYMETNNSTIKDRNTQIRKSEVNNFRKKYITDSKYFCSILPMYSSKKFYIILGRGLNLFLDDPLFSIRLISIISSSLWFFLLGLKFIINTPKKNIIIKLITLFALFKISISLAILSTPDALAILILTSSIYIVYTYNYSIDNPNKVKSKYIYFPNSLLIVTGAILGYLAFYTRTNFILPIICSFIFLKLLGYKITKTLLPYTLIFLISSILSGFFFKDILLKQPDSYSLITVLMSAEGGLFGLSGPLETYIYNITFMDVILNIKNYYLNIILILKSSIKAILPAFKIYTFYAITFSLLFYRPYKKNNNATIGYSFSLSKAYIISFFIGLLGFISQVIIFPKFSIRMVTPYLCIFILSLIYNQISDYLDVRLKIKNPNKID